MLIFATLLAPCFAAQTLNPREPVLRSTAASTGLVLLAVAVQLFGNFQPSTSRFCVPGAFVLGLIAIIWIMWQSTRSPLVASLAGLGALANTVPILVYGAMPVRRASRESFSASELHEAAAVSAKHVEMDLTLTLSDPISLLCDWIPLPFASAVISIGDIAIVLAFVGLGLNVRSRQTV